MQKCFILKNNIILLKIIIPFIKKIKPLSVRHQVGHNNIKRYRKRINHIVSCLTRVISFSMKISYYIHLKTYKLVL